MIVSMNKIIITIVSIISFGHPVMAQNERDSIIHVFNTYIKLTDEFTKSVSENDTAHYNRARHNVETYGANNFDPILPRFVTMVCKTKDSELFNEFLKVLIATESSADE